MSGPINPPVWPTEPVINQPLYVQPNFVQQPAFGGYGTVSRFNDFPAVHVSSFNDGMVNHMKIGNRYDWSLESRTRLGDYHQLGGLEQRTSFLDTYNNSPLNNW
jgi:hypothetical protein